MADEHDRPWMGSIGGVDLPVDENARRAYAESLAMRRDRMTCPNCGAECGREEADVGIGIIYGPWGCRCGWSQDDEYNQLDGPTASDGGLRTDQYGMLYPAEPSPDGRRPVRIVEEGDPWSTS